MKTTQEAKVELVGNTMETKVGTINKVWDTFVIPQKAGENKTAEQRSAPTLRLTLGVDKPTERAPYWAGGVKKVNAVIEHMGRIVAKAQRPDSPAEPHIIIELKGSNFPLKINQMQALVLSHPDSAQYLVEYSNAFKS